MVCEKWTWRWIFNAFRGRSVAWIDGSYVGWVEHHLTENTWSPRRSLGLLPASPTFLWMLLIIPGWKLQLHRCKNLLELGRPTKFRQVDVALMIPSRLFHCLLCQRFLFALHGGMDLEWTISLHVGALIRGTSLSTLRCTDFMINVCDDFHLCFCACTRSLVVIDHSVVDTEYKCLCMHKEP